MRAGSTLARALACSSALLVACAAPAADFAYDANLGIGRSDNIRRTPSNEESENIAKAGATFSLDQRGARLTADVIGDLAYFEYLNDTYDSELLGNFAGNARYEFVPGRFSWAVSDNFGQVLADPFAPVTPENRENVNRLTTGPQWIIPFGQTMRLRLGANYFATAYENSPLDSTGLSGDIGLVRRLSTDSSLSLNGVVQQVDYKEEALNADYDQKDLFLRYEINGARTRFSFDAGYSEVQRDAVSDPESGPLVRLNLSRRVSASSTATLIAGREFSNSGASFSTLQQGSMGSESVPGRQTAQPFTNDQVSLGWSFGRVRTSFSLLASWSDQSYEDAPQLDQTLTSVSGQFRRELSSRTSLSLHAAYGMAGFEQPNTDYRDFGGGVSFAWRLSKSISLDALYDRFKRSSDAINGGYVENRVWLLISYGRGTPRVGPLPPDFSGQGS